MKTAVQCMISTISTEPPFPSRACVGHPDSRYHPLTSVSALLSRCNNPEKTTTDLPSTPVYRVYT